MPDAEPTTHTCELRCFIQLQPPHCSLALRQQQHCTPQLLAGGGAHRTDYSMAIAVPVVPAVIESPCELCVVDHDARAN
eukprot:CAMPEP_0181168530 /NCGR_PEP_ID=MMETSP1096-20121128/326_1 /TAXON_ID=156174 ORGANISM="Chrysochromulina ericina, Strain CCMP281" /NCGR_SAMPLE_ID=MMETSP1096 /ASSEMBLY_ACC=CAM_ASM_000453 /LENGTH=78 /DNA_ID=CAMNT_0023255919 /DNA_START=217 /DNA_END=453 /DNA_ORIENTATION=-